ncbi:MerR family transcriptional regulator [Mumia zhuanghuii]|uniref:MerR family transcriptional regulator n=2 Tax=Mumia TaxID=1546255 RepID=A0ABW1QKY7_9ACTN|nr:MULTISPECIES: MerR family transcriptional regulator [Mumia]KAA1418282.1 MerR family transcriptional regulator [Mumia zhuanghuii]
MSDTEMRVGDAADVLGIAAHVLRHWEDVGLLRPPRLPSGHRVYDDQTIAEARMIQICQRAGLSLAEIRDLAAADRTERLGMIAAKRASIAAQVADLELADLFLSHVVTCTHPVVSECDECSGLLARARPSSLSAPRSG